MDTPLTSPPLKIEITPEIERSLPKGLTTPMATTRHDRWEDVKEMPSPRRLSHVSIVTNENYERLVAFYKVLFNASVVNEIPGHQTYLTFGNEHHRLAVIKVPTLIAKPSGPDRRGKIGPKVVGVQHVAFSYASLAELLFAYEKIKEQGVEYEYCQNRGLTTSIYYYDPDFNEIELFVDNWDTTAQGYIYKRDYQVKMGGMTDSSGTYDPDKMLALLKEGVPDAILKDRQAVVELRSQGKL